MSFIDQINNSGGQLDPLETAKLQQIVEQAMLVFWQHGYDGTNFDRLVVATGVSRKYIYRNWQDKHGLFIECLKQYRRYMTHIMLNDITDINGSGLPALSEYFSKSKVDLASKRSNRGCLIIKTIARFGQYDAPVSAMCHSYLTLVKGGIYNSLSLAKQEGQLAQNTNINHVVEFLFAIFISIGGVADNLNSQDLLMSMIDQAIEFIHTLDEKNKPMLA